jgi:hypothetical protein
MNQYYDLRRPHHTHGKAWNISSPDKPHLRVCLTLYDIDTMPNERATFSVFTSMNKYAATPLYYAALLDSAIS